jgi:predicted heme/steroid binding protein
MNSKRHFGMLVIILVCSILISASVFAQETKYRIFTPEDVLYYDGRNGRPAYVVADGIVYDVSESELWKGGMHESTHRAGMDLTTQLLSAPHGREVLRHMPRVGIFQSDKTWIPQFLIGLITRYPILRRHPHPFFVHFPMVFVFGGAIFMLLHLIRPQLAHFEKAAFLMLIMGIVFTPPAIVSGLWAWWIVYSLRVPPQILYKIILAIALLLAEIASLLLRIGHPFERTVRGWVYFALMLFLAADGLAIGYFGGVITYGY